eukprot:350454-Chlamydomonas_euryale.AAC.7
MHEKSPWRTSRSGERHADSRGPERVASDCRWVRAVDRRCGKGRWQLPATCRRTFTARELVAAGGRLCVDADGPTIVMSPRVAGTGKAGGAAPARRSGRGEVEVASAWDDCHPVAHIFANGSCAHTSADPRDPSAVRYSQCGCCQARWLADA